jgi:hypothetical protein
MYVKSVPVEDATGALKEIYDRDTKTYGHVPDHTLAMSLRPKVIAAWRQLSAAIRENLDQRRFELITTVAAAKLRCRY